MTALLTVAEIASRVRLRDHRAVRELMRGTDRAIKLGNRLLLDEADLDALLDAHRVRSAPETPRVATTRRRGRARTSAPPELRPNWWKEAS